MKLPKPISKLTREELVAENERLMRTNGEIALLFTKEIDSWRGTFFVAVTELQKKGIVFSYDVPERKFEVAGRMPYRQKLKCPCGAVTELVFQPRKSVDCWNCKNAVEAQESKPETGK